MSPRLVAKMSRSLPVYKIDPTNLLFYVVVQWRISSFLVISYFISYEFTSLRMKSLSFAGPAEQTVRVSKIGILSVENIIRSPYIIALCRLSVAFASFVAFVAFVSFNWLLLGGGSEDAITKLVRLPLRKVFVLVEILRGMLCFFEEVTIGLKAGSGTKGILVGIGFQLSCMMTAREETMKKKQRMGVFIWNQYHYLYCCTQSLQLLPSFLLYTSVDQIKIYFQTNMQVAVIQLMKQSAQILACSFWAEGVLQLGLSQAFQLNI